MPRAVSAFALIASLLVAGNAEATRVFGLVSGTVTEAFAFTGSVPGGVGVGDSLVIRWSYESTAGTVPDDESGLRYADGIDMAFSVDIEGSLWQATGGSIAVTNDANVDAYGLGARVGQPWEPTFTESPDGELVSLEMVFGLIDRTAPLLALSSDALPDETADIDLAQIDLVVGELERNGFYSIGFDLDVLTFQLVPEPSLAALVLFGLCLAARRQRADPHKRTTVNRSASAAA